MSLLSHCSTKKRVTDNNRCVKELIFVFLLVKCAYMNLHLEIWLHIYGEVQTYGVREMLRSVHANRIALAAAGVNTKLTTPQTQAANTVHLLLLDYNRLHSTKNDHPIRLRCGSEKVHAFLWCDVVRFQLIQNELAQIAPH